jgi:hypothetical protein
MQEMEEDWRHDNAAFRINRFDKNVLWAAEQEKVKNLVARTVRSCMGIGHKVWKVRQFAAFLQPALPPIIPL